MVVNSQSEKELLSRFQAGRQLYNALLSESMKRMQLVRISDLYQEARKLSKGKTRTEAFKAAYRQYRYSEYDIQAYATVVANRSKWIADKVDSNTQQKLATRAFKASSRIILGLAKKIRFKVPAQFKSMEGKSNKQGIRWESDKFIWGKLKLEPIIDPNNPVTMRGLTSRIKYVRILFKFINGKRRWFAQLINEGIPFKKPANYTHILHQYIDTRLEPRLILTLVPERPVALVYSLFLAVAS